MIKPRERIIANERMPTWLKLGEQVESDDCVSRFGEYKEPEHKPKKRGEGMSHDGLKDWMYPKQRYPTPFNRCPTAFPKSPCPIIA